MIKGLRLEKAKMVKQNIIKDVRNLFRIRKEIDGATIKDISNLFRLTKENEAIKDRVIREPFSAWRGRLLQTSKTR